MTDHPCKGMSARAIEVFEQIAIGNGLPWMMKVAAAKLLAKGLIERGPDKQFRDALGHYSIPQYFVPLAVHAQWCEWCSEQPPAGDAAGERK
jgi:hypothetical protein